MSKEIGRKNMNTFINTFITKEEQRLGFYVTKNNYKSTTFSSVNKCQKKIDYLTSSFIKKICLIFKT